tara:strand:- start:1716 stop:2321 length:606 start_codon:yes stop_codon:yes gene_type:complete
MSNNPHTVPKDGFIGTGNKASVYNAVTSPHHNVALASASEYVLGQKIRYYNKALGNFGTCIYLRYSAGDETLAAGYPVALDPALDDPHYVTGDASTFAGLVQAPTAIALSPMTTTNVGWFWCGGACPDMAIIGGASAFSAVTVATDDSIVAGSGFESDGATDGHIEKASTGTTLPCMGIALADDGGVTTDMANLLLFDNWA